MEIFLPVDTLTYRGLWIEGLGGVPVAQQQQVIATARAIIVRQSWENTGALVPLDEIEHSANELCAVADTHGQYQQWVKFN